jgi:hypothetical protein
MIAGVKSCTVLRKSDIADAISMLKDASVRVAKFGARIILRKFIIAIGTKLD